MNDDPNANRYVARRAVQALRLWPGDAVVVLPDGSAELRRALPPGAVEVIRAAEKRGDLRRGDEVRGISPLGEAA